MEITRNNPTAVGNKLKTSTAAKPKVATALAPSSTPTASLTDLGASASYDVALSPNAAHAQKQKEKAYAVASQTSPIREDKVQALKDKISRGEYVPDSNQIADGIVREAIRDQLARDAHST